MPSLNPEALTWTGLLTQWVKFAQASMALPPEPDGQRWRASVPAIINLQAVTFALADLPQLPADEQALGLDKAEMLITENAQKLKTIWQGAALPLSVEEIAQDARSALQTAKKITYPSG